MIQGRDSTAFLNGFWIAMASPTFSCTKNTENGINGSLRTEPPGFFISFFQYFFVFPFLIHKIHCFFQPGIQHNYYYVVLEVVSMIEISLLEYLALKMNCEYLSDLRYKPVCKKRLRYLISETYAHKSGEEAEWMGACVSRTGERKKTGARA